MAGASPSPHKARRKATPKGPGAHVLGAASSEFAVQDMLVRAPSFPLAALLWSARAAVSQWETLPLILMVTGLFRWAAGLWGYSGFERPPMFGDYEAQRHWMEVTTQLPVSQWYFHDLPWWGLDYPPLTAYHSWLCGKLGALINPAWFELYASRGSHDPSLKIFMRATVLVSEYLIYVPCVAVFVRRFSRLTGVSGWSASVALVAILMQPGTILIDHVHFQYNTVMLGFVVATMSSMLAGRYLWSAVFFVAALAFKQMALYYACSVFAYLLGSCFFPRVHVGRLVGIAITTLVSFALVVLPIFLGTYYDYWRGIDPHPGWNGTSSSLPLVPWLAAYLNPDAFCFRVLEQALQILHRIFPFARGLFEDKVANFWCALNLVVKVRTLLPAEHLPSAALAATLAAVAPPNVLLFLRPRKELLPLAFAATAWGFFLFSFQVHEKSVLLPLLPMTLLLAGRDGLAKDTRAWVGFSNLLGAWTLFPLLRRVDLAVPYAVLTLLWAYLLALPPTSLHGAYHIPPDHDRVSNCGAGIAGPRPAWTQLATALVHWAFYSAMAMWHVVELLLPPPQSKPDLWVVANVSIGAAGFCLCYLWCLWRLAVESDILPESWARPRRSKKKKL